MSDQLPLHTSSQYPQWSFVLCCLELMEVFDDNTLVSWISAITFCSFQVIQTEQKITPNRKMYTRTSPIHFGPHYFRLYYPNFHAYTQHPAKLPKPPTTLHNLSSETNSNPKGESRSQAEKNKSEAVCNSAEIPCRSRNLESHDSKEEGRKETRRANK